MPVLRVVVLWHQHQPYYKDLVTGEYELRLIRPDRRDEAPRHGSIGWIRQWIESVNDTLKGQLDLERHGGRHPEGIYARIAPRLPAMAEAWHARNVTMALKAYAALTTSAARGAVRVVPE